MHANCQRPMTGDVPRSFNVERGLSAWPRVTETPPHPGPPPGEEGECHVGVRAACTGVAHGPHPPSKPDRPSSTSLPGDNDARGAGPSGVSVPTGFALFGSVSGASVAP